MTTGNGKYWRMWRTREQACSGVVFPSLEGVATLGLERHAADGDHRHKGGTAGHVEDLRRRSGEVGNVRADHSDQASF